LSKREIVTLCGSVRFRELFDFANRDLTLAGYIVLQPGVWEHDWLHKPEHNAELRKDGLDSLHCDKIRISDMIGVINPNHYLGKSTSKEIQFAESIHKPIFWLEGQPSIKNLMLRRGLQDSRMETGK